MEPFKCRKGSLDFLNVLQNGSFKNCSLKGSFRIGTENGSFVAALQKHPLGNLILNLTYKSLFQNRFLNQLSAYFQLICFLIFLFQLSSHLKCTTITKTYLKSNHSSITLARLSLNKHTLSLIKKYLKRTNCR